MQYFANSLQQGYPTFLIQGPHKLLHNSPRARHLTERDCFRISYILPNEQIFHKYIIFSLLTKCLCRLDEMALWAGFGRQAVVWRPLHYNIRRQKN